MTSCRCVVAAALLLPFLAVIAAAPPRDPVSQKARDSAERAIRWLLDAQNRDGSWGDNAGSRGEVGNTCIAALALLGHGSTPTRGPHWHELRRGLDWLRVRTNSYGEGRTLDEATLLQRKLGDNADLYLVTLLYSEVVGMNTDSEEDRKMQQELGRMTARIASLQQPNGEWETSYEPMLTTTLAWLALKQAHAAGITIKQ
ncbi:MAG TPA: hypothetical protein VK348_02125, partial [Planctomycetota bacterium]|nr:hypothetical protein [Planctomycetota bacterium]